MNSNYSYTARDSRGETVRGTVEAPGRSAALAALKARGLVPVSLADGPGAARPRRPLKTRWLAAAAALLALLLLAPLFRPAKTAAAPRRARPKPAAARPVAGIPARKPSAPKPAPSAAAESAAGPAAAAGRPAPAREAAAARPAATNPAPDTVLGTNRVVRTVVEQELGWIANTAPGSPPPPLLALPSAERANLAKILGTDIVLYDDDSEAAAESKYNIARAKLQLKDYLAQGGTPEEFLAYYHADLLECHKAWREAQAALVGLVRAGDLAAAAESYRANAAALKSKGVRALTVPPALADYLEKEKNHE